jgi:hypothetical protein
MKRYVIFALVGAFFGGLLLLFARTAASGYWTETNWSEVGNFFVIFVMTLPYNYLFLVVQALWRQRSMTFCSKSERYARLCGC